MLMKLYIIFGGGYKRIPERHVKGQLGLSIILDHLKGPASAWVYGLSLLTKGPAVFLQSCSFVWNGFFFLFPF